MADQDRAQRQVEIAKILFEWWWVRPQYPHQPRWDACAEHIQAFWMDGAWRVMRG